MRMNLLDNLNYISNYNFLVEKIGGGGTESKYFRICTYCQPLRKRKGEGQLTFSLS